MLRSLFLIFFFCGLTVLSVVLEYRASAEAYVCPSHPREICVPVKPADCGSPPDCSVLPPLRRSCERAWQEHLIGDTVRSPQSLCFVSEDDKLNTVAMVSTLDIMRAMGR